MKKKGIIVTNNHDTLNGWIGYNGWNRNPQKITFWKDSSTKKGVSYSVTDLEYFRVADFAVY
jgi:hypothetical protein